MIGEVAIALRLGRQGEVAGAHQFNAVSRLLLIQMTEAALARPRGREQNPVAVSHESVEEGRDADGYAWPLQSTRRDRICPRGQPADLSPFAMPIVPRAFWAQVVQVDQLRMVHLGNGEARAFETAAATLLLMR